MKVLLIPGCKVISALSLKLKFTLLITLLGVPIAVLLNIFYLEMTGAIQLPAITHTVLLIAVGLSLVGGYFFLGLCLSLLEITSTLRIAIGRFAKGDLAARAKISNNDEFGETATAFNDMARAIKTMIGGVSSQASCLSDAVTQLSSSTEEISTSSQHQRDAAANAVASIEEVTESINRVAAQAQETREVSLRATELSEEGSAIVREASEEMTRIAGSFHDSSEQVKELGKRADEINHIVQVISDIAEQTNLLALNAAIEAARAGEQGRGFAVVADEVRTLAERTSGATDEISTTIATIQANMNNAVASMSTGAEQVIKGVEKAERAGQALQDINQGAKDALEMVNEIAQAVEEQHASSGSINANIEQISEMAALNSSRLDEISSEAKALDHTAEKLKEAISAFSGGTSKDATELVERAAALINSTNTNEAFAKINNPLGEFINRDLYIFIYNLSGKVLAHGGNPDLIGKDMLGAKDPQGKAFVKERIEIANAPGQGWQDYVFKNPETGDHEAKTSYIQRVGDLIVGCGIYK